MIQYQDGVLTVFQSELFQTTSTVAVTKDFVLVVDPTWLPSEVEVISQHVKRVRGKRPLYLLFTHGDFDHIIGYQAFPNAIVIGSARLVSHPAKAEKVQMIKEFDNGNYIKRSYTVTFPKVDIVIKEDGQQLKIGDTSLTFYLAKGHTEDGLFTIIEPLGIWVAGDYLSDFELPFIYHSAKAYSETLEKARRMLDLHEISFLVPGHGQTTEDPKEIQRRIDQSISYLARLISAVTFEDKEALNELDKEMAFPSSFTRQCHSDNVEIIRKEFNINKE